MTTIIIEEASLEFVSCIPAEKFFKAILDIDNLPKIVPHLIQSVEDIDENIKKVNLTPGPDKECTYVKLEVVIMDEEKFFFNFVIIEVDTLQDVFLKIEVEISFEVTPCGGSIFEAHIVFNLKTLNEQAIKKAKNNFAELFKAIEAHLLADVDA